MCFLSIILTTETFHPLFKLILCILNEINLLPKLKMWNFTNITFMSQVKTSLNNVFSYKYIHLKGAYVCLPFYFENMK